MKKQFLLVATLFGLSITSFSQKQETARLLVHYKFMHVKDTNDRAHPYTENMALLVGTTASVYKSFDGMVADELFRNAYLKAVAGSPDGNIRIDRSGASLKIQYYQYPNEQKLLTKDYVLLDEYLIEGPMPVIEWKISGDTATFGGLRCQKATGHFRGRDYIAWYCPDVPVPTGPWKLNGLPGVIVDARDTKNEVVFQFDDIEKVVFSEIKPIVGAGVSATDVPPILRGLDDNPAIIAPPARAIRATQKEYDKLKTGMQQNPGALVQGMAAANGASKDHVLQGISDRVQQYNNPIELPERK